MNQDTGEMKLSKELEALFGGIPKGWSEFSESELITIKNCVFRIQSINTTESIMVLKGVSKKLLKEAE